jgi:spermidine synthase
LRECSAKFDVVLGDARLSLARAPDRYYDLIVLDAFSSDGIPVHLLTREALKLYLAKLADGGILSFHISNRYLDLKPVVGDLARDAGVVCLVQEDVKISEADIKRGKTGSIWVVMAKREEDLGKLVQDSRWKLLESGRLVWSDDFSNILSVFRWR